MYFDDYPINSIKDDKLDRDHFVNNLNDSITKWGSKQSLVIGINGKWGSGKSSILNLLKEKLKESEQHNILDFNPWLFSKNNITKHFFKEIVIQLKNKKERNLASQLEKLSKVIHFKEADNLIDRIINRSTLILALFGLSLSQFTSNQTLQEVSPWIGAFFLTLMLFEIIAIFLGKLSNVFSIISPQKTALDIKNEISDHLESNDKRLVVFIDDIDRLEAREIKEVIKLVKVSSDFPNTIFILAYDKEVVINGLEKGSWFDANTYLEKIIQVNFDIPEPDRENVINFLTKSIDSIIEQIEISRNFQQEYWTNVFHEGIRDMFSNIRDVKRFLNSFKFNFNVFLKKGVLNVNITDLIALEAIRLKYPLFFEFISRNKSLFTDSTDTYGNNQINEKRKKLITDAFEKYQVQHLENMLKRIFPQLSGILGNIMYGSSSNLNWARDLRVCSPEYFDQYFNLLPGGSKDAITQFEVVGLISSLDDKELLKELISQYNKSDRLAQLLSKFENNLSDADLITNAEGLDNLILELFNISNSFERDDFLSSMPSLERSTVRITFQALKDDPDNRFRRLKTLIEKSTNWYAPIYFAFIMGQEDDPSKVLFSVEQIEELKKASIGLLEGIEPGELENNSHVIFLLYRLKEMGLKQLLEKFTNYYLQSDNFIGFLGLFISKSRSTTIGDYYTKEKRELNLKGLEEFIDIKKAKELMDEIGENQEASEIVDMFNKAYEKVNNSKVNK